MQPDPREEIITLLPRLRRFALSLTGESATADDLVQDSCLKALERWHQWRPGTSPGQLDVSNCADFMD